MSGGRDRIATFLPRAATGIALLALCILAYALITALHEVVPPENAKLVGDIVTGLLMIVSGIAGWMIRDHAAEPLAPIPPAPPQPPAT